MKIKVTYLFLFIVFTGYAQSPFSRVRSEIHDGIFSVSNSIVDSCLSKNFMEDSSLYYKGLISVRSGELKEAKKTSRLLAKKYPAFGEAAYLAGLIHFTGNNYVKSIDDFNLVLRSNPSHFRALYNRSVAFGLTDNYLLAIEDLDNCIRLSPGNAHVYYSRGYWRELKGDHTEAGRDYEQSIKLDPKAFDAYYGLAYIYHNQKETSRACDVIKKAIEQGSQIAEELRHNLCPE